MRPTPHPWLSITVLIFCSWSYTSGCPLPDPHHTHVRPTQVLLLLLLLLLLFFLLLLLLLLLLSIGLSVLGRDTHGVFPLRGKLLNARNASRAQLAANTEIKHLVEALGLESGLDYGTKEKKGKLRYGHLMLMTDQDHDGSHIKGLVLNLFHTLWPSLLRSEGFLKVFHTPIIKASTRREEKK